MKKLLIFLFVLVMLDSATMAKVEKVKISADANYPPYTYVEDGELKGIFVDVIKEVDKKLKDFEIILEPTPWARALKMLETGQTEAIIDAWYRPKERPYMSYSVPVLKEEIIVITITGKGGNWPKDFVNKKIGINRGFATFKEEDKKVLTIEEANSTEDNIMKLLLGRIDYYANDRYSIFWEISNLIKKGTITRVESNKIKVSTAFNEEYGYIGYRKTSSWEKKNVFIKQVDDEIKKMQKNGELEKIIKKYTGD